MQRLTRLTHLAAAVLLAASALPAFAQQDVPPPPPPPPGQGPQWSGNQPADAARFEQRKQEIIAHLQQRQQMLAQAITCLQQAQTPEQARACRPRRPRREGGRGGWRPENGPRQ